MDSGSRHAVTVLPLRSLDRGGVVLDALRGRQVGDTEVRVSLRDPSTSFTLADVGAPLAWFDGDARFDIWKKEIQQRLVPPHQPRFFLSDYPGEYCYVATEWLQQDRVLCICFEKHH